MVRLENRPRYILLLKRDCDSLALQGQLRRGHEFVNKLGGVVVEEAFTLEEAVELARRLGAAVAIPSPPEAHAPIEPTTLLD